MFHFNNTHIFTGYLKQLLSSKNIPACRIYTQEFAKLYDSTHKVDDRILESFDAISQERPGMRINYVKGDEFCSYMMPYDTTTANLDRGQARWERLNLGSYDVDNRTPGLTKTLVSLVNSYDQVTHEYLGEYLRFLRDYYGINLMSLYNCFNNSVCNNIDFDYNGGNHILFNSLDSKFVIYAIPVRLFEKYTIAIDCARGAEMFCGLYNTTLNTTAKALDLINKTYTKFNTLAFNRPVIYDKLIAEKWPADVSSLKQSGKMTRWDIAYNEQNLKLFIKVPVSCRSSITILEGDFKSNNNCKYDIDGNNGELWRYQQNHCVLDFNDTRDDKNSKLNSRAFNPISKLQLLALNTGESYPFADRLVEYIIGSAITPIDDIPDNIKRAQRVMKNNNHYFKIEGAWEDKMRQIIYDYIMNSGPVDIVSDQAKERDIAVDRHRGVSPKGTGYHRRLGHTSKSTLYDVLGYIDKDAEKWYASWRGGDKHEKVNKASVSSTIQNIDIYDQLYDI